MRLRLLVPLLVALVLTVASCGSSGGTTKAAPRLADPTATAKPLLTRYFELTQKKDTAGLQRLLSRASHGATSGVTHAKPLASRAESLPGSDSPSPSVYDNFTYPLPSSVTVACTVPVEDR